MINVTFTYISGRYKYQKESNTIIKEICLQFCDENNIDFNSVYFVINALTLDDITFNKTISEVTNTLNRNNLAFLVYDYDHSEEDRLTIRNNKVYVIFNFDSKTRKIEFSKTDKMLTICRYFSYKINRDFNSLIFKYRNTIIDFDKKFSQIATQDDMEERKICIYVEDKNNINRNQSFCENNKKSIIITVIIISVIIIIFLIILFTVILKDEKEETEKKGETIKCEEGFDLYNNACIIYAFFVTYKVDNDNEKIKLFNQDKINNIYAMKIENKIMEPNPEFYFNQAQNHIVFYYLLENSIISLSYLFENIKTLIDFSFNDKYINNFNIRDLRGMFFGCSSLKQISFGQFEGQNVTDISHLFSNCVNLISVDFFNV